MVKDIWNMYYNVEEVYSTTVNRFNVQHILAERNLLACTLNLINVIAVNLISQDDVANIYHFFVYYMTSIASNFDY